jgi:CubicO group peptidase (beta-lactamase class C family)
MLKGQTGAGVSPGWRCLLASVIAGLAALAAATPSLAAPTPDDLQRIAQMEANIRPLNGGPPRTLAQRMAELKVPGVSLAFFENGRVRWTRAYGAADAATGAPVTPTTRFQAASMTKAVAATVALRLVEQGRLDLDQDVNDRLASWKVPASGLTATDKVTLRRLLSHTAGLTVHGFDGYPAGAPLPTLAQVLNGAAPANSPPVVVETRPGTKWSYSGGGYTVAQMLMTDVTATPFAALAQRYVLGPMGMTRSTLEQPLPASLWPMAATAHGEDGRPLAGRWHAYPEGAAAGLWTTPSDYARFMIGLQDAYAGRSPALLSQASAKLMMTPVLNNYGLGWDIVSRGARRAFDHHGGNDGFECFCIAFLDGSRQGVVIMTNGDGGLFLTTEIADALAAAYGWPPHS